MIIYPDGLTAVEWTDYVAGELEIGPVPQLRDSAKWKEDWATPVCMELRLRGKLVPDPGSYTGWIEWANDFNKAVRY